MYSLDTSFFMDWQARYYPLDLFPTLERNIVGMIAAGTCGAVELVREEIDAVGTPGLRAWASSYFGLFLPMTELQLKERSIKRLQTPDDLMDTWVFLCSSDSYIVTRRAIVVDGGSVFH